VIRFVIIIDIAYDHKSKSENHNVKNFRDNY
jgi:hypothetical protein